MTPLETLQKYGLKTDTKSIIERRRYGNYFDGDVVEPLLSILKTMSFDEALGECYIADYALLCERAEECEQITGRYDTGVKVRKWLPLTKAPQSWMYIVPPKEESK
jgi:hypothetical protein